MRVLAVMLAAGLSACVVDETAGGPPPPPDSRVKTTNVTCGGESFRLAFESGGLLVIDADGSNTDLRVVPPPPNAEYGIYTNGAMTFTKQSGRDKPTVIRFARGRMAFQDCAIAQN